MRKYLCWFLMAVLALASLHSGCGGSSGGGGSSYDPDNPDNPTTIYDFSVMEGSWTVSDGRGTAVSSGGTFDLALIAERTNESGGVTFSNLQVSSNRATGNMKTNIYWSVSQNGQYVRTQLIDFSISAGEIQKVSGNTWHTLPEAMFTVTITSPTTANMVERASVEVDGNTYNYEVSYKLTKRETSTTPNNPNTPTTPDNPATPDNPSTVYDFSILSGTWVASNGRGTVTGGGVNTTLSLSAGHSNTITFKNVIANSATLEATLDIYMDAAGYSEQWEDDFGGAKPNDTGVLTFQKTGDNTWRMDRTRHNGKPTYTIITLTSSTTAQVERYDEYDYQIHASYTLTKQNATPVPDNPATDGTLSGTWRITGGSLSEDGSSANYVQRSASAETFTLTLSDAGDGRYVLSVSGEGVREKEGSPYVAAYFEDIDGEVRVVWGTSEYWEDWPYGDGSTYKLTGTNTYSAEFPLVTHDVREATYQFTSASTILYTQRCCLRRETHGYDCLLADVELTLTRVN